MKNKSNTKIIIGVILVFVIALGAVFSKQFLNSKSSNTSKVALTSKTKKNDPYKSISKDIRDQVKKADKSTLAALKASKSKKNQAKIDFARKDVKKINATNQNSKQIKNIFNSILDVAETGNIAKIKLVQQSIKNLHDKTISKHLNSQFNDELISVGAKRNNKTATEIKKSVSSSEKQVANKSDVEKPKSDEDSAFEKSGNKQISNKQETSTQGQYQQNTSTQAQNNQQSQNNTNSNNDGGNVSGGTEFMDGDTGYLVPGDAETNAAVQSQQEASRSEQAIIDSINKRNAERRAGH